MAVKTGYLTVPSGILRSFAELGSLPPNQIVLLATGSQGEPTSALVRMANRDYSQVQIIPGDTVIISATPIPGNEMLVNKTIDSLFRQGANVVYDKLAQVHVHGHGSQEELKLLLNLVKPQFFIPIHGEYRHLSLHAKLAESLGIPKDNIFILEDGDILELGQDEGKVVGKAPVGDVCVSGLVTGELDRDVLQDRKLLSRDGVVVVTLVIDTKRGKLIGKPRIETRGFIDVEQSHALIEKSQDVVLAALNHGRRGLAQPGFADAKVKDSLSRFFYERTHRRPIIILVTMEV
jgi:ribonuclease J